MKTNLLGSIGPAIKHPKSVTVTATSHEPGGPVVEADEPEPAEKLVERAKQSKINATHDWIDGRIASKEHDAIHARADKVIANPHRYVGGEIVGGEGKEDKKTPKTVQGEKVDA